MNADALDAVLETYKNLHCVAMRFFCWTCDLENMRVIISNVIVMRLLIYEGIKNAKLHCKNYTATIFSKYDYSYI